MSRAIKASRAGCRFSLVFCFIPISISGVIFQPIYLYLFFLSCTFSLKSEILVGSDDSFPFCDSLSFR